MKLLSLAITALLLCATSRAAAPPLVSDLPKGAIARLGHARMIGDYNYVLLSPDGKSVYSGKWFNLADGKETRAPIFIPEDAYLTRFFSDGSYLVHGNQDSMIFAPNSDKPRVRLPFNRGYDAFDSAGRFCLQVVWERKEGGMVAVVDLRQGDLDKSRRILANTKGEPYDGRLSGNGTHAVWLEFDRKGETTQHFCIYDLAESKMRRVNLPAAVTFACVAICPDGKSVVCYDGKSVYLFDSSTGKRTRTVSDIPGQANHGCEFAPNSKEVAVSTKGGMLLVPTDPKKPTRHFPLHRGTFFPDSQRMVTQGRGLVITINDLKTGKQLDNFSRFPAFDGVRMIGEHVAASWNETGFLVTWDVRTGRHLTEATLKPKAKFPEFREMRFSPDGRHVVAWTVKGEGLCVLAETASGKVLKEMTGPPNKSIRAFFHPFRSEAAIYDPERKLYRWVDLKTGKWTRTLPPMDEDDVHVSPDGRTLLSIPSGDDVRLRESLSGKVRWRESYDPQRENSRAGPLHLAALVRKGRGVVVVRHWKVSVFDTLSGRLTASVHIKDPPRVFPYGDSCAVSANRRWLAVVSDDTSWRPRSTVRLYDLLSEEPAKPAYEGTLPSPTPFVFSLALDSDGSRLITAHLDGTCYVWDLKKIIPLPEKKKALNLWQVLADLDPARARQAIVALSDNPAQTVKLFSEKLTPPVEIAPARITQWVKDLDSEDFDRRSTAERALMAAGDQAEESLQKAIDNPLSLEQRRRAERLLKRIDPLSDGDYQRHRRAIEILESIDSKETIALLEKLAKGAPAARLTREAKESLHRLKRRDDS